MCRRGKAAIHYKVSQAGHVTIKIYDVNGGLVRTLVDDDQAASTGLSVDWDGMNEAGTIVANGVYIVKVKLPDGTYTKKVVVLKKEY